MLFEEVRRLVRSNFELWSAATRFLALTITGTRRVDAVWRVEPRRVLITVWRRDRYERIKRAGIKRVLERSPPTLFAYETVEGVVYVPVDGNHRVAVAEDAGLKSIPARVTEVALLPRRPTTFYVWDGLLWRGEGRSLVLVGDLKEASESELELAGMVFGLRGCKLVVVDNVGRVRALG